MGQDVDSGGTAAPLGVVVVSFNCSGILATTVGSTDWTALGARVVVVDNSTDPAEAAATGRLCRERGWRHLPQERNLGFGAASNIGAAHVLAQGADVVLLLNPDAWIAEPAVRALVDICRADAAVAVSPVIEFPDGRAWFTGGRLDLRRGRAGQSGSVRDDPDWLTGAALAMSAELWRRSGGFDDDYFLYWEDIELSARVRGAGGSLRVLSGATAQHSVGATQGSGAKSATYVFYNCRNRLRYAAVHVPPRLRWRWVAGAPRVAFEMAVRGGKTWTAVWAAIRGTGAGLAAVARPPVLPRAERGALAAEAAR